MYRARAFWRRRRVARVVVSFIVLVLGAGVTFAAAGAARTLSMADRYENRYGRNLDIGVEQFVGPPRNDELRRLPSVAHVTSATFVFGGLDTTSDVETIMFFGRQEAFGTRIVGGREPRASTEFAASNEFLESNHAHFGQQFDVLTLSEAQGRANGFDLPPDQWAGPKFRATLVGEFAGPGNLQDPYASVVFPPGLARLGSLGTSATEYAVGLRPGRTAADLRRDLDTLPDGASLGVKSFELVPDTIRQSIGARGHGIAILTAVIGLAALAVTGQLLWRQVRSADAERRVLLGLGGTRRQLVVDPTIRAALAVAPTLVLGGLAAFAASGRFPLGFAELAEPRPGLLFDPTHVWAPVVWCLALVGWVAVAATRTADRPARSTLPAAEHLARRAPDPRAATGTRFAFTPSRSGGSVWAPLIGLSLVGAGMAAALIFGSTVDRVIDEPARFGAYDASVGQGGDSIDPAWIDALTRSPRVSTLILGDNVPVSVDSTQVNVAVLDVRRGSFDPPVSEGHAPAGRDEIMLGRVTAEEFGLSVGDRVTLRAPEGTVSLRVSGIGVTTGVDGGEGVGEGGVVTADAGKRLTDEPTFGSAVVDLTDGSTPADIAKETNGLVQIGRSTPPSKITNLTYIRTLPYVIMWVLAALALLGVGHQLLMAALHRRRDHGILRSMGADRGWVTSVVHWHAVLWTTAIVVIAVPIGVVAGRILSHAFIERIGAVPDPDVPIGMLALLGVGLVLLANLVALIPGRRARRSPVTAALAGE